MKIDFKKEYKLDYSLLDKNLKIKPFEAFNLAQNTATEYFKMFHGDNISVRKNNNAAWVVTKAKVHFYKNLNWLDKLQGHSYITKVKPIRVDTETAFRDSNNELVFLSLQQSCPLDIETRKIRKINTVSFPNNLEEDSSLFENNYLKLSESFDEKDFVYEQKVYSQDIDYSNHVNNSIYIRYILNALNNDFLDSISITDIEIHYISESKEGQILRIYKKNNDDNNIEFLIKEQEREIVRGNIRYTKI